MIGLSDLTLAPLRPPTLRFLPVCPDLPGKPAAIRATAPTSNVGVHSN